jgi:hypothetical protein
MKNHWASILLLVIGCGSSSPLASDVDGAAPPTEQPDGDEPADDPDCGPMENLPCRFDSDCRDAYLACVPPGYVTIDVCRDPVIQTDPACPYYAVESSAPLCPQTVQVTSTVCEVRYQHPCTIDTDCGPAGFTCVNTGCQPQTSAACETAADCPTGWECYVPCACPGVRDAKFCQPPFAVSFCPACPGGQRAPRVDAGNP